MSNFTDLVRKLHSIEENTDTTVPKSVNAEKQAIAETANVLKAFDAIEQQTRPERTATKQAEAAIAKGGELLGEKAVSKSQQQAAGAALAAKKGDAPKSKLTGASKEMMKMSTKELEKIAGTKHKGLPDKKESIEESEDLTADLRQRFAKFMQTEIADGADLAAVEQTVTEGTYEAQKITQAFDVLEKHFTAMDKIVREGGVLWNMVERHGGDTSGLADIAEHLARMESILQDAEMYARAPDMDEE